MISTWVYETAYHVSARAALEALQDQVLEDGAFSKPWHGKVAAHSDALIEAFDRLGLLDQLIEEMAGHGKRDTFERLRTGQPPRDRVEAVLWSGAGGTKSILDAEEVEPMSRSEVVELFGAPHPDVDIVREQEATLHAVAGRSTQFLVAYEDGLPIALFFFGTSGD